MKRVALFACLVIGVAMNSCKPKAPETVVLEEEELPSSDLSRLGKPKLSEYGFFTGTLSNLQPGAGVVPYTLNSPLFSDYAFKKRFVRLPPGQRAIYNGQNAFEFPVGTVLIKNFYYPLDFHKPEDNIRIIETRLLIRDTSEWKTLPYVWNEQQTEAFLEVAGSTKAVHWTHTDGAIRNTNYSIPNTNQCKGCHLRAGRITPIGPSARQLNGDLQYTSGRQNQLAFWKEHNMLDGLPPDGNWPKLASYENVKEPIERRARAWLEVNCAHCHGPEGPARNSGLYLSAIITNPAELGVGKAPVAAGKGTGGRLFGIVPGKPEESILQYRIESTDPGIMMPEMGRKLRHEEGIDLVREWIRTMK